MGSTLKALAFIACVIIVIMGVAWIATMLTPPNDVADVAATSTDSFTK